MNPNDPSGAAAEKARLYHSAVESWEKGEMTSALGKLEELAALERDFPETDASRRGAYELLYHQVRSAHDALQTAIAETDRRVEEEADLGRRTGILEEALQRYPGEPHFEQSLEMVREKRDVVNSIVAKARFFEERGQPGDALDQWQILRSIYPRQPGLESEIQRLSQGRTAQAPNPASAQWAAQAPNPASAQWVEQARQYLESGDYQRALQTVAIGLLECPGDTQLMELEKLVTTSQARGGQALELLARARESSEQGAPGDALAALWEAHKLDSRNSVIRTVLVNSLLEQARRVIDTNWQSAEAMVQEVLRLDPANAPAQNLMSRIEDRKTSPPPTPIVPAEPPLPSASLPRPTLLPQSPASPPEAPALPIAPSVAEAMLGPSTPMNPPPAPAARKAAPKTPAPRPPAAGQSRKLLFGTAAAAVVLVLVALGVTIARHQKKPPPPVVSKYAVVLRSTPEGAAIKVNGDSCGTSTCTLQLSPGAYQAEAELTGYQSATLPFTLGPGTATNFTLTLTPQGPRVTIFTDLAEGTVSLDDAPAGQIQGGGAEIANLQPGKHVLSVKGGDSTASIPIEISPGTAPSLAGSIDAKNLRCFLVAGFGGDAHLYGTGSGYRVTLDGKPMGGLGADGMPLPGLSPGTHELALDSDAGQHDRMDFESQPSATLFVSLQASQNLGMLSVETNEDQAHLLINGQKYKRDTARGRLVVYLFPRKYTVTVQKDGFAPPVEQTVEVKKGEETKVSFTLLPAKAILAVHHAPPGTDVLVDNISRGTAHPDGEFQVGGIDPGPHTVTLRHDGYKPIQSQQTFAAGKTVDLPGALEAAPVTGTLRFDINPPGLEAHVRIRKDGDPQDREVTGSSVTVPEGRYLVTVSAPQFAPTTASVQVNGGGTAVATMTLRRLETSKAPAKSAPTVVFGLEDWIKLGGWERQDGMIVHKGGEWVMATPDIAQGTIRFTVVSLKGKRVGFGVACRDEKNFIYYELDDKNLTRYEVRNGNKMGQVKVPHMLDRKKPMGISLAVTPQSVVFSVMHGGWLDIDKWDVVGSSVHGRFGFRIPGSDEIGLPDFQITLN